jgi:hypothetical protein
MASPVKNRAMNTATPNSKATAAKARKQKLAETLRANLKKRKELARKVAKSAENPAAKT